MAPTTPRQVYELLLTSLSRPHFTRMRLSARIDGNRDSTTPVGHVNGSNVRLDPEHQRVIGQQSDRINALRGARGVRLENFLRVARVGDVHAYTAVSDANDH